MRKMYVHYEELGGSSCAPKALWTTRVALDGTDSSAPLSHVLLRFAELFRQRHGTDVDLDALELYAESNEIRRRITRKQLQKSVLDAFEQPFDLVLVQRDVPVKPKELGESKHRDSDAAQTASSPVQAPVARKQAAHPLLDVLRVAQKKMQQHRYRAARELYESLVLPVAPLHPDALLAVGDIHAANGRWEIAVNSWYSRCWRQRENPISSSGIADKLLVSALKIAQCQLQCAQNQSALETIKQMQTFLHQHETSVADIAAVRTQMTILKARALYATEDFAAHETAISLLVQLLPDLQASNVNLDALLQYARIAHDRGKKEEALHMVLRVLTGKSTDKSVKQQLVDMLTEDDQGMERLRRAVPFANASCAPAYAFLATLLKDFGAMDASVACFQHAVDAQPFSASYALNLAHGLEIRGQDTRAYHELLAFFRRNPHLSVDEKVSAGEVAAALDDANGWESSDDKDHEERDSSEWRLEWIVDEKDCQYAQVYRRNALFGYQINLSAQSSRPTALKDQELDLLACFFTVVKILFLSGQLEVLPHLISLIEPVRVGKSLHQTTIRNEHAYYSCIAQLLSISQPALHQPGLKGSVVKTRPIFVCGDSHTLATAWREISVNGERTYLHPALVTGLKHWHLRKDSSFYPKANFWNVLQRIPVGSRVVFVLGEIDCREGILRAVEKCKYETIEEGMAQTIGIFMDVLQEIVDRFHFDVYIHPVVPVLNETRALVVQYNRLLRAQSVESELCKWLDFFDDLLMRSPEKLRPEYALDGTHLHPRYLLLVERELSVGLTR